MNDEQFNNQLIEILRAMNNALEMIARRIDLLSSSLEESGIIKNNQ